MNQNDPYHCFQPDPTASNTNLPFQIGPHCFKCKPAILTLTPLLQTWACCFEPTQMQAHHFQPTPMASNMSPLFWAQPHCFKHKPTILSPILLLQTWSHCFKCKPTVSNPPHCFKHNLTFQMQAYCLKHSPTILDMSPLFWMQAHH